MSPSPRPLRLATALALTALGAALAGMAFPPWRLVPLAWVGLAPFLVALRRTRGVGSALLLGFVFGEVYSVFVALAFPEAISTYALQPLWVGWLVAFAAWAVTESLYVMGFALLWRGLAASPAALRPLLGGAAWVANELARGRLLTGTEVFVGNPWALLGYSQVGVEPLLQLTSLTGIYGVSFVLAAVSAALAELWLAWRAAGRIPRAAALGAALAGLPALLALGGGFALLRGVPDTLPEDRVQVAVAQGNVNLGTRWRTDFYGQNLDVYLDLTRRAFASADPQIVFWPEGAFTFLLEVEPAYQRAIARVLAEGGAELVAGGPGLSEQAQAKLAAPPGPGAPPTLTTYNSIFLISPEGALQGRYDKQHLVPFTEFLPLSRLDFVARRFERVREFSHGAPTPPLPTRAGAAGILTCNESMLPEVAARRVAEGASYLVSPSNDSNWATRKAWMDHLLDMAIVRAVEQRRWLVRASTSGPSAIIDPWGRVSVRGPLNTRSLLLGEIAPRSDRTLYGRVGDLFGFACVAVVALALLAGAGRSSQTRPSAARPRSAA